jgi:hypothetical protein
MMQRKIMPDKLLSTTSSQATILDVVFSRHNQAAADASGEKHEELIADGWEFLSGPKMTGENWVVSYLKREI